MFVCETKAILHYNISSQGRECIGNINRDFFRAVFCEDIRQALDMLGDDALEAEDCLPREPVEGEFIHVIADGEGGSAYIGPSAARRRRWTV